MVAKLPLHSHSFLLALVVSGKCFSEKLLNPVCYENTNEHVVFWVAAGILKSR